MTKLLITICARGGSKGLPGKNIRPLAGRPLITYTIDAARRFAQKHDSVVELSTDDAEIRRVAAQFGLITEYHRPATLATDEAGKVGVISDLLRYAEEIHKTTFDFVLDLDVSSPLRTLEDLETAFRTIRNDDSALNLFSVNVADKNPYFNMVEEKADGYFDVVKKGMHLSRQQAPKVFELNASFYFYRRLFFTNELKSVTCGRSLIYEMPHVCFDIDNLTDFEFMEFLIGQKKLGMIL